MPQKPQDELESSLTALLLGELPHEQAAALHQKLAQDAELAKLYERLKHTINLVRETVARPAAQAAGQPTPLKLSDQRREKLLQHFKTVAPKEFTKPQRSRVPVLIELGIAAGLVFLLGALFLPALSKAKSKSAHFGLGPSLAFRTWSMSEDAKSAMRAPAPENRTRYYLDLNRNGRLELPASKGEGRVASLPATPPALVPPEPAKPAGTQQGETGLRVRFANAPSLIVLPQGGELADATTTPPVLKGVNSWTEPAPAGNRPINMAWATLDGSDKPATVHQAPANGDVDLLAAPARGAVPPPIATGAPAQDAPGTSSEGGVTELRVFRLANADASQTADQLAQLFPPSTPGSNIGGSGGPGGNTTANGSDQMKKMGRVMAVPDPRTSSLIVTADRNSMPQVGDIIKQLDAGEALYQREKAHTQPTSQGASDGFEWNLGTGNANLPSANPSGPFPGGTLLGPREFGPSGGNHGEAQNRPVLRSPKEGGLAGGGGAAPLAPAPSSAQETAINEAVLRQAERLPSPQNGPAFKGTPKEVPVLSEVPVVGGLFRSTPGAAGGSDQANIEFFTSPQSATRAGVDYANTSATLAFGPGDANGGSASRTYYNNGTIGDASFSLDPETRRAININYATAADIGRALTNLSAIALPTPRGETSLGLKDGSGKDVQLFAAANQPNLSDAAAAGEGPSPLMTADTLRKLESLRIENKAELVREQTLVNRLKEQGNEQDAEKLAARVLSLSNSLDDLEKEVDKAYSNDAAKARESRPYFEAKRQLEELQRFRQILDAKIASEKIDAELPKTMVVEVVDKAVAQPSQSPTLGERIGGALGGKVERTARIKIEHDQSDINGMADRGGIAGYDPYFLQTEFEVMQSEAVLGKVIKELNLNEAWGKKQGGRTLTTAETMALLKNKLDLRPERNSDLIDVGVKSDQPEEAAQIANAVAEAYKEHRAEQRAQLTKDGIKALEEGRGRLDQQMASAKADVDRLESEAKASSSKQAVVAAPKPAAPAPIPQPEVRTAENAFSTFSLNVSDVSFKLAAASLEKGVMPEPATVRSEEFINAFDYRDPEPPPGVPVAFAWERAQYPFAQNRDLLRFSIKTAAQGRQPGRPLNLVLLLDNSGSMERADRVRIIHEALRVLAGQLQPQDKFSVVTFARTARLWVDGVPGSQAAQVVEEVSGLTPQGGTNLEDAMNLAYQTALRHYLANGVNRVVLLTDGAANLGNVEPEALKQKVEAHRKQGVALDCFGIGWEGYNDDLLEVLSRNGDGRYAFINTPEEAGDEFAAKLAGALQVAASDVKVQVEFNPGRVTAYRQIGYAKHQLTKEQFRDNTVNAAQIGAAEAGNALYVVEVNPGGSGPLCTVRVRFRIPGTADYREHAWDVPYTGNTVALEQASPAMRLATTGSAFSEWLVSSPYAAEVTPDRLLGYLSGVPEVYGADARPKKLEWMIRQAKSIAGK
ncbi:MAG: von Willebrand factor type A domain-containing protein [Verrucomicrobiota bacterium]